MEITWYGLGCFSIDERGYPLVLVDPFDEQVAGLALPPLQADLIAMSRPMEGRGSERFPGLRGGARVLAAPGEYEVGGLFITAIAAPRSRKGGAESGQTLLHTFDFGGVTVCHLGEASALPTQSQLEALSPVSVLLIPVGLPDGLTPAAASEVVSSLEPDIVVPMHYSVPGLLVAEEPVTRFLKEMGVSQSVPELGLKVPSDTAPDGTRIVVLQPQSTQKE